MVVDLSGEVDDKFRSLCQVASPNGICVERWWNARKPGQRTWVGWRQCCEAPVQDGRHILCGSKVASAGGCQQVAEWMLSRLGRQCEQMRPQGWPSRLSGEPGNVVVGMVQLSNGLGSEELFSCDVETVGVALDSLGELGRWVVELAQHSAGGERRFVAGEDLLQRLGRRAREDGVGSDEGVGVAVADHLEVEMVGVPAAGEHRVQLLPGFLPGQQAMHRVGGDALGRMDGGGVAKTGRRLNVVGGESDGQVAAGVSHGQVTVFSDVGDHPAVPVFHPIRGGEAEAPVVAAGDDHISDTRLIAISQRHSGSGNGVVEAMLPGTAVEFVDELSGGRDHDRVEPRRPIRNPSLERILGRGRDVADMNTAMINIKVERVRFTFSQSERCRRFTRIGEAMKLGQVEGAVAVLDVAEDAAGADRGELLIITNQSDTRTTIDRPADGAVLWFSEALVAGAPVLLEYRGRHMPAAGELDAVGGSPGTDRFEVDRRAVSVAGQPAGDSVISYEPAFLARSSA
jgi:hypothetical protein